MRPSLPSSFAKIVFCTLFATLAISSASAQAVGFGTPPPSSVNVSITGCSGAGNNVVPVLPTANNAYGTSLVVCPDGDYSGGNLGPVWNELDLVPFRLTTTNKAGGGTVNYSIVIAGEFTNGGIPGWDVIGSDGANNGGASNGQTGSTFSGGPSINPTSSASCSATWDGYFTNGLPAGSSDFSIYRVLDITQGDNTTCVWDYYMRLALGSHLYPGSSLHGYKFEAGDFSTGSKNVPLPVNQFGAQTLAKNMSATQNSDHMWTITKQMSPVNGFDTCSLNNANTPVTVTVSWKKLQATPSGPITVITNINATNQADRAIYVAVNDTIYIGATQVTVLGTGTNVTAAHPFGVLVPAHANNSPVLTDTQIDSNTSDTGYNDVATATYTDPITGITIPGQTQATASSPVSLSGTTLDQTASIVEIEGMKDNADTFNFLDFTINSHTDPSGGTYSGGYVEGNLAPATSCTITQTVSGNKTQVTFPYCTTYDSGTLSSASNATDSGSISFKKTVSSSKQGAVTTGTLGDVATLTTTDTNTQLEADASAGVAASASVAFTINKTISDAANITFTFHIYDLNNCNTGTPPVCQEVFGNGNTSAPTISFTSTGGLTNSVTVNLPPSKYSVHEDVPTGWTVAANDLTKDVSIDPSTGVAPCAGSVSFTDTQEGHIIVKKLTVPSGSSQSFTFTPTGYGTTFQLSDGGSNDSGNIAPGPYSVSEGAVTGWSLTGHTCDNGDDPSAITLAAGQTITCTFTNTQLGTIIVNKVTSPAGGTGFTFTGDAAGTIDDGQNITVNNLAPGTYHSTESAKTGWDLTNLSCTTDGSGSGSVATFNLHAGETITCTFTNTQRAHIIVKKVTVPSGSTQQFTFTPSYGSSFQLADGGSSDSGPLTPGSGYSVSETVPTGWDQTGATCDNGNSPSAITLAAGATVTCTFTNTQRGTIIVKKVTSPAGGTGFAFTGDAAGTINDGQSITVSNLAPGTYHSTESAKTGWDLTNLSCTTDGSGSGSVATFNLHAGETITCTFTNTQRGTIIVKKVTNPAGGTGFAFTGDAAGTIDDGQSITVSNLAPGTYHSTESAKTGWDLTNLSCTTDGSGSGSVATFNLHAGETITCTFTNTQRGTIIVKKVTNPAGGTGFAFTGDAAGTIDDGQSITVSNLVPGTYHSTESAKTGWDLTNLSCTTDGSGSGSVATFTLHAGETITCTFTNRQRAKAKVIKTFNGGPIPAGACGSGSNVINPCAFTFQLRSGASAVSAGTILETGTANAADGGIINFTTLLVPGTQYELCEQMQPGWMTTLGPPLYAVFNPSGDNSVVCTNFTPTAGQTATFSINNLPPPGGMGLTIGFWKNWSSCTGGGQKPTLDQTLLAAANGGTPITIGTLVLNPLVLGSTTACVDAVDILSKSTLKGVKQASNPFYNLAAQLLGADLNITAGAGANACVMSDINSSQKLLVAVGFNGSTVPKGTTLQQNDANYFQTQLNNYNNNLPVSCTITYP